MQGCASQLEKMFGVRFDANLTAELVWAATEGLHLVQMLKAPKYIFEAVVAIEPLRGEEQS